MFCPVVVSVLLGFQVTADMLGDFRRNVEVKIFTEIKNGGPGLVSF